MRWCTEQDILKGKGSKKCGNKHCDKDDEVLKSYEVNMSYEESGVWKNAMVKVNVCTECALKVNYKALKERIEKRKKKKESKKLKKKHKSKRKHNKKSNSDNDDSSHHSDNDNGQIITSKANK